MAGLGEPDQVQTDQPIKIIVISGPTCSGKSSLAIEMAKRFNAEIISADSRQIYRQLKIGTDRLDRDEMQGVEHHLMGIIDLGQRFTAFDFVKRSEETILKADSENRRAIICGGTGLYIRALTDGIFEIADSQMSYRNELLDLASTRGPKHIYDMLAEIDPISADDIHPNNLIKIIRALEIYYITGVRKSELLAHTSPRNRRFRFRQIILSPDRELLYNRIDSRVNLMIENGLIDEAKKLYESSFGRALNDTKVVGYAELIRFFDGDLTRDEAISSIKQNTRRYAKRQFTWFRSVKSAKIIKCFGPEAVEPCAKLIESFLAVQEGDKKT
jgi:tRNA dimethylallyltransferase